MATTGTGEDDVDNDSEWVMEVRGGGGGRRMRPPSHPRRGGGGGGGGGMGAALGADHPLSFPVKLCP